LSMERIIVRRLKGVKESEDIGGGLLTQLGAIPSAVPKN